MKLSDDDPAMVSARHDPVTASAARGPDKLCVCASVCMCEREGDPASSLQPTQLITPEVLFARYRTAVSLRRNVRPTMPLCGFPFIYDTSKDF